MLNRFARAALSRVFTPVARLLVHLGVSPDIVTILGTLGVCAGALLYYPRGEFFWGTVFITCFVFSDAIDGTMARMTGRPSRWGAFLDSSLDRLADGVIFATLALGLLRADEDKLASLALYCLVVGSLVPYLKARAESLQLTANVGVAERADRLVVALVATGLHGLNIPYLLATALWIVAIASSITVFQRSRMVRRQVLEEDGRPRSTREVAG